MVDKCNYAATLMISLSLIISVATEDPYRSFEWHVTYGDISPLGVKQQVFNLQSPKNSNQLCVIQFIYGLYLVFVNRILF